MASELYYPNGIVYIFSLLAEYGKYCYTYKIGYTYHFKSRSATLRNVVPFGTFTFAGTFNAPAPKVEKELHQLLSKYHVCGEVYAFDWKVEDKTLCLLQRNAIQYRLCFQENTIEIPQREKDIDAEIEQSMQKDKWFVHQTKM
jgi:hypothetical protein